MSYDLDFEQPLAQLEQQIAAFQEKQSVLTQEEEMELQKLKEELRRRTAAVYQDLTPWQTVLIARHKDRPYALDYIRLMCTDFFELRGDRQFGDDPAIVAGFATIGTIPVMLIGQQKGRTLKEKQFHNFGMPHPEGYRKANRLMHMAEKFRLPVICLIDTPGAFPGLEDEERGQAGAIASNLYLMARLRAPILSVVIGEGSSGGALALGIADRLLMLEHSIYTVAAPEAAASILWRDASFAPQAADAMQINAHSLLSMRIADELVPEPIGGAHHDHQLAADHLKNALTKNLLMLGQLSLEELLHRRYQKLQTIGLFELANASPSAK